MEKPPPISAEAAQVERLVIDGIANGIKRGHYPQKYGEMLIKTYQKMTRKSPVTSEAEIHGAEPPMEDSEPIISN